ncbi:hypothetical protein Leryth_009770 [Lithospermum erythrorhizon]|nr:hypothetical protein Leryth_009770 [Lithospermum erythrorhizon]
MSNDRQTKMATKLDLNPYQTIHQLSSRLIKTANSLPHGWREQQGRWVHLL